METKQLTFDEVKKMNLVYHSEHCFSQSDYEKCLEMRTAIEQSRDKKTPKPGDIVEYTDKYGYYYKWAHIEGLGRMCEAADSFSICEEPYVPFVTIRENGEISTSTSGGAWTGALRSELSYVGTREKWFKDWGMSGACGNGSIQITAVVNVWSLNRRPIELRKYTTKDYRTILVTEHSSPVGCGYLYTTGHGEAWRNKIELDQFLARYHAVEEPYSAWPNMKKYWIYKHEYHWVYTKKEFENICGKEYEEAFNGRMRPVKHITEGTTVHCYVDRTDEDGTIQFLKDIGKLTNE